MLYLVDTGVLLRLFKRDDPNWRTIRQSISHLRKQGHGLVLSLQNVAEFWNVCTRPADARGGFGLTIEQTYRRLRVAERLCSILPERPTMYSVWANLVKVNSAKGVQVHDARLVAFMLTQSIDRIVTLNRSDFTRYSGIQAFTPTQTLTLK